MPSLQEPSLWIELKRLGTAVIYLQNSGLPQKDKDIVRTNFKKLLDFIIEECSIKRYNQYLIEEVKKRKASNNAGGKKNG